MEFKDPYSWDLQSKASWLDQIKKDNPQLRDEQYFQVLDNGIIAQSFAFKSDVISEGPVVNPYGLPGEWKSGLILTDDHPASLKTNLHAVLDQGAEYIHFYIANPVDENMIRNLLNDVHLDMIHTSWHLSTHSAIGLVSDYIFSKYPVCDAMIIANQAPGKGNSTQMHSVASYRFSNFSIVSWSTTLHLLLNNIGKWNKPPDKVLFEIELDDLLLFNICKIRALTLVLNKIWKLLGLQSRYFLESRIHPFILTKDKHSNLIKLGAIASTAVIAGIDYMALPAADDNLTTSPSPDYKTVLHLQHIIRYEARLDHLIDPTAGSYYIENLTEQIAEALWKNLQEKLQND